MLKSTQIYYNLKWIPLISPIGIRGILLPLILLISLSAFSQSNGILKTKSFLVNSDTIRIDSVSIIPGSEIVRINDLQIDHSSFSILYWRSLFIPDSNIIGQQVEISYRVFALDLTEKYFHKDLKKLQKPGHLRDNSFIYRSSTKIPSDYFNEDKLEKRGNISRGISFGNRQDVIVNSSLNLQLSGKLSSDFHVKAAITDDNIPIQPNGNSQQIQDFDKVFIQVYNQKTNLIVGDIRLTDKKGRFLKLDKNIQGASFSTSYSPKRNSSYKFKTELTAAVSKGKYNRQNFMGIEGNQGPYKLTGADNESYIIIIAGSEKVYIDGELIKRGEDNDYVIDYNMAELSFTTKRPITKDKRIIVEFEYSERNYTRYLVHNSNEFISEKSTFYVKLYSEQDNKNQPLMQNLSDSQMQYMASIGDSLTMATVPNIDSIQFTGSIVLYKRTDTIVNGQNYTPVYIRSVNPDSAFYKLGFTYMGLGNGNYEPSQNDANGKVYEWIAPNNNSPSGSYEPVVLLITPKKKQVLSIGGIHNINSNSTLNFDLSISNTDINTYSDIHRNDNVGFALDLGYNNQFKIQSKNINGESYLKYHFINKDFSAVENFRSVEFNRDWNIQNNSGDIGEHYILAQIAFNKDSVGKSSLKTEFLGHNSISQAIKNEFNLNIKKSDYSLNLKTSYLFSQDKINETGFFRNKLNISKNINSIIIGLNENTEYNRWKSILSDSLNPAGTAYNAGELYITNKDSATNKFKISYLLRQDLSPLNNSFKPTSIGQNLNLSYRYLSKKRQSYKLEFSYRKLSITDSILSQNTGDHSINSRIELNNKWLNGGISSSFFYEIGSGLEQKKEYLFIEVSPGQGVYIWNDYNSDNVQQIGEFEISSFQDTANFIRVFIPGNEYEKILSNKINQNISINPSRIFKDKGILTKFARKFTNRTVFIAERKNSPDNFWMNANPYQISSDNVHLKSLNSSFRNILSFNRNNSKYGLDYMVQNTNNRILLVNGFDISSLVLQSIIARYKISPKIRLKNQFDIGEKSFESEYFSNRDYKISHLKNSLVTTWIPILEWNISLNYNYEEKTNISGNENSSTQNLGIKVIYKLLSKGNLDLSVNYIKIDFTGETTSSPIAYEMLGGFQPGNNLNIELRFQTKVTENLQLNLNYSGRNSENSKMIHTGGVQLRAFF